jgi:hypothetical protein
MSALSLCLPGSVHRHIKELASKESVSINQFIASAVAEKVSAIATKEYLQARAERTDKSAFQAILAKLPKREPLPGDELWQTKPGISKTKKPIKQGTVA